MKDKNFRKEMYKGTAWSLADNFIRQLMTFGIFIVLARLLEPEIFGLLSVSILIVQIFRVVTYDSIATAILRKADPSNLEYNTAFWTCIGLSIPAFVLLFISAGLIEQLSGTKGLAEVMRAMSIIILTSGLTRIHEVWLTHRFNFRSLTIRSTASTAMGGIAGITMAFKGYGVYSVVGQQVIASFTELILLWFITPWRPKAEFSKGSFYEMVSYSKHVALTSITNMINQNSDIAFITYYLGAAATGIYTTAKRIPNTLNSVLTTSLVRVSLPAFSKLQDDDESLRSTYLSSTAVTALITAPIFTGLAILSKDITLLMLGPKWLDAVIIMQLVTIVGFLPSIGQYNQNIMLVRNKPQWQAKLRIIYAATDFVFFFLFTRYGLIYTAIAFTVRAIGLYPLSVWYAIRLIGVSWRSYVKALFPSLFSSAIMALILIGLSLLMRNMNIYFRVGTLIVTGLTSYTAVCYFVVPVSYRETASALIQSKIFKRK